MPRAATVRSAVLCALLASPLHPSGYHPGPAAWMEGRVTRPIAVAACCDHHVLVLETGDRSENKADRLFLFVRGKDQDGGVWRLRWGWDLPGQGRALMAGPVHACVVVTERNLVVRRRLMRYGEGWALGPATWLVGPVQKRQARLGTGPALSYALAPGGALLFGFERRILEVVPAAGENPEAVCRWHLEDRKEDSKDGGDPGLFAAADPAGRILAVDRDARTVIRLDPGAPEPRVLLAGDGWPSPGFVPDDAVAWGDRLLVAGFRRPGDEARTLVLAEPGEDPDRYRARDLGLSLGPFALYAVTPAGHLAVIEPGKDRVKFIPNRPAPAGGRDPLDPAQAVLDRAQGQARRLLDRVASLGPACPAPAEAKEPPKPAGFDLALASLVLEMEALTEARFGLRPGLPVHASPQFRAPRADARPGPGLGPAPWAESKSDRTDLEEPDAAPQQTPAPPAPEADPLTESQRARKRAKRRRQAQKCKQEQREATAQAGEVSPAPSGAGDFK
ncbi:MAG: hypothetical protein ABSH53_22235 [Holophaga sp.]